MYVKLTMCSAFCVRNFHHYSHCNVKLAMAVKLDSSISFN